LLGQDYPKDEFEIIVVDDRGDYEVEKMLLDLKKEHKHLYYLKQNCKGPATARNLGIKHAKADIVAFVDDDCQLERNGLKLMTKTHEDYPNMAAVGGDTLCASQPPPVLVSQFLATGSIQTVIRGNKEVIFFPTCNVSFKRKILERYNFNENFPLPGGEDLEFFWRLFKAGMRFIWNKNIKLWHYRDSKIKNFIQQAYIYGRGNLLTKSLHQDHPLLKELKTGKGMFWLATLINIIKIPRFSFCLGRRLIKDNRINNVCQRAVIYMYFVIHKIFYLFSNSAEYLRIQKHKELLDLRQHTSPQLLILDITHSCNLSCRICDIWKTRPREEDMNIVFIKKMLVQARQLGVKEIALSGGEPLLRKDIFEIIEYARCIGIKDLGILTNGILVEEQLARLTPYLVDNTISLVISLDSVSPYIHNYIRNSDFAWGKTMQGLKALSKLKKEYSQLNFNVIAMILDKNLEELIALVPMLKSFGVNSLQFQALLSNNLNMAQRNGSDFWIKKERVTILDETIDKLIQLKTDDPRFIKNSVRNLSLIKKYFRNFVTPDDVKCASANKTILISNQGQCTTCFTPHGDIKTKDLEQIVKSRNMIAANETAKKCKTPCLLPCFCDMEYEC